MAINRLQKKMQIKDPQRTPASVEEFIASAVTQDYQSEIAPIEQSLFYTPINAKKHEALNIIESYIPYSVAAGILPLPVIDLAAIVTIQLSMLAKIGNVYGVPFKKQAAQSAATTLMASCLQQTIAFSLFSSVKFIPVIGQLASITIMPAVTAAGTYALGRVFITHFEAGGTFLNFQAAKMHNQFSQDFQSIKKIKNKSSNY